MGMTLGAKVGLGDWWLWNQIPVTIGNIVGGFSFTGLALCATYRDRVTPALETAAHSALALLSEGGA